MAQQIQPGVPSRLNETRMTSVVGSGFGASVSASLSTALHAQHGAEVIVGLDTDVLVTATNGETVRGRVVLVQPDWLHRVDCPGTTLAMIYDCEEFPALANAARSAAGVHVLGAGETAYFDGMARAHAAFLDCPKVLEGIAGEAARKLPRGACRAVDKRVQRALRALRDPDAPRSALLAESGLSEAHLQALFVRDVGVPMRAFRVWQRVLRAALALRRVDATHAAHQAGFADLAHFSRACSRMLGYSPRAMQSALRRSSEFSAARAQVL